MPRPCNASPSACTSARRSQRSSRSWTRSSTAWLSGYARAKHSVSCSELSSLPLRQRAPQARRSRSRSAAASGPKVSRSLASRRMARARWGTRRVLLTRASLFAGDAVPLYHALEVVAIARRHQWIGREPADMALVIDRRRGDLLLLRLVDRVAHRAVGHDVAKTPVAVDHCAGTGLLNDGPRRARNDMASLDAVDIGRDKDDPMRIVTDQIGADVVARDRGSLFGRRTGGLQQGIGDIRQAFG